MPIWGLGGGKKDKSTPFSHFKLVTLQLSHHSQDFMGEKHHFFCNERIKLFGLGWLCTKCFCKCICLWHVDMFNDLNFILSLAFILLLLCYRISHDQNTQLPLIKTKLNLIKKQTFNPKHHYTFNWTTFVEWKKTKI